MQKRETRLDHDSLGVKEVPADAYWGANAERARANFNITGARMDEGFIRGLAEVKKACALTNKAVGLLEPKIADAIAGACNRIIAGEYHAHIVCDPVQGGAGTSFNMNMNEVIANIASLGLGGKLGEYKQVHPNDHVNYGQSTNDVIPSAAKVTLMRYLIELKKEVELLADSLTNKSVEFDEVIKMGRTQLQDAVPIRLGQEFAAYAVAVKRGAKRLDIAIEAMSGLNLGGTAVGTGMNADRDYVNSVVDTLKEVTKLDLHQEEDLIDATQNTECYAVVSSMLKVLALSLSKIANDLRLLSSGPRAGFGEIDLPAKQAGSSIMPGKVNPVIPEVVSQVAYLVAGNDVTVTMAVEAGQLELNAFGPVIFHKLFESIRALKGGMETFRVNCIDGITANVEFLKESVEQSIGLVTAVAPHLGYEQSAEIAKEAQLNGEPVRQLILAKGLLSEEELNIILDPFEMTKPGIAAEELILEKKNDK